MNFTCAVLCTVCSFLQTTEAIHEYTSSTGTCTYIKFEILESSVTNLPFAEKQTVFDGVFLLRYMTYIVYVKFSIE